MVERYSCALASRAQGEACYGTASQARRWILVEQPGAWGANAPQQSGLPLLVGARLRAAARSVGARLLLIRRHGRVPAGPRTCFAVTTTREVRRVERLVVDAVEDLLDVDWAPLASAAPVGGEDAEGSLYLVCTNGSHDACCAQFGRPVARALHDVVPEQLWESSHYGGDRFAGNLVCLPEGVYYGRVDAETAAELVWGHERGELDLDRYRGRSFETFVGQAGEHFVRAALGLTRLEDAGVRQVEHLGDEAYDVAVKIHGGRTVHATVQCSDAVDPQRLTCKAADDEHPPRYRLVALT